MRVSAFGLDIDSTNYVLAPGCRAVVRREPYQMGIQTDGEFVPYEFEVPIIADAPAWFGEYLDTAPTIGDNSDQAPAVDLDQPQNIAWAMHYLETMRRLRCRAATANSRC